MFFSLSQKVFHKIIKQRDNVRRTSVSSKNSSNRDYIAMKPVLYGDEASPPVRAVLMTASVLNFELEFHKVDLFRGENKLDFYKQVNPLMKVPALAVGNKVIRDSHAICLYLCQTTKNQDLYPTEDNLQRSSIDDLMFFNASSLFPVDSSLMTQFFSGKWPLDHDLIERWNFLLDYLELRLQGNTWLAGDQITVCDICCIATVTSAAMLIPISEKNIKLKCWINNLKKMSFYKHNERGLERLKYFIHQIKTTNRTI